MILEYVWIDGSGGTRSKCKVSQITLSTLTLVLQKAGVTNVAHQRIVTRPAQKGLQHHFAGVSAPVGTLLRKRLAFARLCAFRALKAFIQLRLLSRPGKARCSGIIADWQLYRPSRKCRNQSRICPNGTLTALRPARHQVTTPMSTSARWRCTQTHGVLATTSS